jgi:hypothetical protein
MYRSKKVVRTTLLPPETLGRDDFFDSHGPACASLIEGCSFPRRLQLSDTNGERYLHQIRPVCLKPGPTDGIFQQAIDMLVDSLLAWARACAGFLLT